MARRVAAAEKPAPRKRSAPRRRSAAAPEAVQPPEVEPFLPPPLDVAAVRLWNAAYRRRRPWQASLAGRPVGITFEPLSVSAGAGIVAELTIAGQPGALWVPEAFADELLGALPPQFDPARLSPASLAMLAEFALLPGLAALETRLGAAIVLTSLQRRSLDDTRGIWVDVRIVPDGREEVPARLLLPSETGEALIAALGDGPSPGGHEGLPCPVAVRIGATTLPGADVASLRIGDAVLLDAGTGPDAAVAVVGEHLAAPVVLAETGIRLEDFPRPAAGSMLEWCMTTAGREMVSEAEAEDTPLAMVPVSISSSSSDGSSCRSPRCSGSRPVSLCRLPCRSPARSTFSATARIGRGTMVRIGESIGVRIVRLAGHG